MRWMRLFAAILLIPTVGCEREKSPSPVDQDRGAAPTAPTTTKGAKVSVDEIKQTIKLKGFDSKGEPVIRVMGDGSLLVVFSFMPPSFAAENQGLGTFADFDKQMERAAGVPVVWDDREVFVIQQPKSDTIERVRAFIESYRGK